MAMNKLRTSSALADHLFSDPMTPIALKRYGKTEAFVASAELWGLIGDVAAQRAAAMARPASPPGPPDRPPLPLPRPQ